MRLHRCDHYQCESPHPESARYVPLKLTLKANVPDGRFSFHFTDNLQVCWKTEAGEYEPISSNYKLPLAMAEPVYWVKAIGAGETGFPSGLDKVHVVLWNSDNVELARDTVCFKVQDNASHLTDWVIPNEWTINGGTVKTPMPAEGAIGPQEEWTGKDYNAYNKGDAYTKQAMTGAFTLSFNLTLDSRPVQPDTNANEKTDGSDKHKLSFVANSGVKFGPLDADKKYEIAILDVVKWVDMIGGLSILNNAGAWLGDKVNIKVNGVQYAQEPLSMLMSSICYGGKYANMRFAQGVTATGWEYYYQVLKNSWFRELVLRMSG